MKNRLNSQDIKPKNKKELKQLIQKVHDDISYETINDLLDTFPYRIQIVYDHGGKTIEHIIRKNYYHIPEKYIVPANERPPILTQDTYMMIYKENLENPHKWTLIAQKVSPYQKVDRIIVKNKSFEIERRLDDYHKHKK